MIFLVLMGMALLLVGIALTIYGVSVYNGLITVKHQVEQAWSNIDVLLRQRHDELPKLIDAVKGYLVHERALLERITTIRAGVAGTGHDDARLAVEGELSVGIGRLLLSAEAYPELQSNRSFLDLQQRITALEEQIAHRREFFNAAVNLNNVRMEQVPERFLAGLAGMRRSSLFVAHADERRDLDVGEQLRATSGPR